jgi:hypothetical protein
VADSPSCRHLSQVGSSVNPSLKMCPLRWQCPVSNPTTYLSWSLFSLNRSFVRLAEGPDLNPFAYFSPVVDSQYFLWFLFVQSLTAFLAAPIEMPQARSKSKPSRCRRYVPPKRQAFSELPRRSYHCENMRSNREPSVC